MPTNERQDTGRDLLLTLPNEIKALIYDSLSNGNKTVRICHSKTAKRCCEDCHHKMTAPGWSPWSLTQVSNAHSAQWLDLYYGRTGHYICLSQLGDYLRTFCGEEGCSNARVRRGQPAHRARAVWDGVYIDLSWLPALDRAYSLLNDFGEISSFSGTRCFLSLLHHFRNGCLKNLLPNAEGAEQIEGLFLCENMNLWVHPKTEYLSLFPALNSVIRKSLFRLWISVPLRFINLRVIPEHGTGLITDDRWRFPSPRECDLDHPFWRKPPHGRIKTVDANMSHVTYYPCFIVRIQPSVLRDGNSLTDIGIDEEEFRKRRSISVYIQLADSRKFLKWVEDVTDDD